MIHRYFIVSKSKYLFYLSYKYNKIIYIGYDDGGGDVTPQFLEHVTFKSKNLIVMN